MHEETDLEVEVDDDAGKPHRLGRRAAIGLASGGIGAAAGLGVGLALADSSAAASERLSVDVACIGETFRSIDMPNVMDKVYENPGAVDPGDLRGTPFSVEGWMYPEGTISGSGFVPTVDGAIGHWFCRGHFILHAARPGPHLMSHHEYVFGLITPEALFPRNMLCSVGLESSDEAVQSTLRAVNGGTGDYRAASGQVEQFDLGTNSTLLFLIDFPAPSFRFDFDLLVP